MNRFLVPALITALSLNMQNLAWAQSNDSDTSQTQTDTQTTDQSTAENAADVSDNSDENQASDAAASEETPSQAPSQREVVVETHGDWEIRCIENTDNCIMFQQATNEAGEAIAEYSILNIANGGNIKAGVTVVTPIGTLLTRNLVVGVDAGKKIQFPYQTCYPNQCIVRYGLDNAQLGSYKKGNALNVRLYAAQAPEQAIDLKVSLTGFTAAFNALAQAKSE